MSEALIWLVAVPLAGALLALLLPRFALAVVITTGVATTLAAGLLVYAVGTAGTLHYAIGGWSAGLGITLRADGLSALLVTMSLRTPSAKQASRTLRVPPTSTSYSSSGVLSRPGVTIDARCTTVSAAWLAIRWRRRFASRTSQSS